MKPKTWIWIGVVLSFIMAGSMFLLDQASEVLVATALGYTGVLSAWLGFDILKTRDRTLTKPNGEYEMIRLSRYLFAILSVGAMLVVTMFKDLGDLTSVKTVLVPCVFGMVAGLVTAYGANKNATPKGPE